MKTRLLLIILLSLAASAAAITDGTTLWLDDENVYECDTPFTEQGFQVWLTATTPEDCDGGGSCDWGWSEGVISMHPVRLVVDLAPAAVVDSVTAYYWGVTENDARLFLYDGTGGVIDQAFGEWYGEQLTVHGGTGDAATLAFSGCDAELYEITLWLGETSDAGAPVRRTLDLARAWPNPFNPACNVEYVLEAPGVVSVEIFDAAGARVRTLLSGVFRGAGRHAERWDGRDQQGRDAPAGVYLCQVRSGSVTRSLRMTLAR